MAKAQAMIEPMPISRGPSVAKVICDDCQRSEVVACAYDRCAPRFKGDTGRRPKEKMAVGNVRRLGWTKIKGKLRCKTCEAKRKVKMLDNQKKAPIVDMIKEPTKKQRLEIIGLLMDVYDLDVGRYKGGDTDDSVAGVLEVMPGWVAEIREKEFGPDGGNEDIDALIAELVVYRESITDAIKARTDENARLIDLSEQGKAISEKLNRIKSALGPRTRRKAGVANG